ncbi:asparaginase [Achromobacter sp. GG226]|uniref:asparaginase n=1 Tax=Verticiella alkaliphila TaxID=2779529 RepID=UPI001C0C0F96|nr:asparaginase [Verticiella sp. GG226]MBU4612776.1 asparaginase [Verticiella sp. GG226]
MRTCALMTTGGTIVSRIDPATGLANAVLSGDDLLAALAPYGDVGPVEIHDVVRVSSPQIGLDDWRALHDGLQAVLAREDVEGAVVTHGTATLEETAWFLDLTLATDKPVVVTGAQRNASEPDFDGPRNLFNALQICRTPAARGKGVMVALNGNVNAARQVTKSHTLDVETFQSGEWGYLASVVRNAVIFRRSPEPRLHVPLGEGAWPDVPIVPMYVGATGAAVRAAVAEGAQGLVIEAVASGHVNEALFEAVLQALEAGVPVVIATRIPRGHTRVGYGFAGSSALMTERGAVLAGDLSPWKARILLMLAIQGGQTDTAALRGLFGT